MQSIVIDVSIISHGRFRSAERATRVLDSVVSLPAPQARAPCHIWRAFNTTKTSQVNIRIIIPLIGHLERPGVTIFGSDNLLLLLCFWRLTMLRVLLPGLLRTCGITVWPSQMTFTGCRDAMTQLSTSGVVCCESLHTSGAAAHGGHGSSDDDSAETCAHV